jgi:dimethylargininase
VTFTRAVVRPPGRNFAAGLTSATEGAPHYETALAQHLQYCEALAACGLKLTRLQPDAAYPDGTFVEDTAIVTPRGAIVTRPGAPSRTGEVDSVSRALIAFYMELAYIDAPGTVDGGDVCEADGHFLIAISARTNESGARQLKGFLERLGYTAQLVDIRSMSALLHLKTGIAYLGEGTWAIAAAFEGGLPPLEALNARHVVRVSVAESYSVNCVRVNDRVLVASGYPALAETIERRGLRPLLLDMSEYKKMDGGLSCLSLRI